MFRRFPLASLALVLVVAALWALVGTDKAVRKVARSQWHIALVPFARNFSYEFLDENRAEDRLVSAQINREKARPLVDRFPRDAALLAVYLRGCRAVIPQRHLGPLFSSSTAWSVQINYDYSGLSPVRSPSSIEQEVTDVPALKDTEDVLRLAARGQTLEPQNTYWDWMEMAALLAAGRERELPLVLNRATQKREWNDHVTDQMRALAAWNGRERSESLAGAKMSGFASTLLPHLALMRSVTRSLAQQVMGLRLQNRDEEALRIGLQTMRLARVMRLNANLPITSSVALACEAIILRHARVPLGPIKPLAFSSPPSGLARRADSLLALAQNRSPIAAREIAVEWTRLGAWKMDSTPGLFDGLISSGTLEGVAWTTRAASFVCASLPIALVAWLGLSLVAWRIGGAPTNTSRAAWGAVAGMALPFGFLAFDWTARALTLRANPVYAPGTMLLDVYVQPEDVLSPYDSLLSLSPLMWGAVTLWLGMWAFRAAFASPRLVRTPGEKIGRDKVTHPVDIVWNSVKWIWRGQGRILSVLAPLWILALSMAPLVWPASVETPLLRLNNLLAVVLALSVWPIAVGVRQVGVFSRNRTRPPFPARFFFDWRSLLGGYLLAASLVLPALLFAQSRFERDFNAGFAPIEEGHMISAIQKMRGLPMQ